MEPDFTLVKDLLGKLNDSLTGLHEFDGLTLEQYLADAVAQSAVERRLQVAIQICIDIATETVARAGFRTPTSYLDVFHILREEGVISRTLCDTLLRLCPGCHVGMVALRRAI